MGGMRERLFGLQPAARWRAGFNRDAL